MAAQEADTALSSICSASLYLVSTVYSVVLLAGLKSQTALLQLLNLKPVAQPLKASIVWSVKWRW